MRSVPRLLISALLALVVVGGGLLAFTAYRAHRTFGQAAEDVRLEGRLKFTLQTLPGNPGGAARFEAVASPDRYTSVAMLNGDTYLSGASGIAIYAPDGTRRAALHPGSELPSATPGEIVVGRPRGAVEPELLIATAGAGLLILSPNGRIPTVRQMLPSLHEARDLTAVLALPSGDVLLGTRRRGLLIFHGDTLETVRLSGDGSAPPDGEITALAAAGDGSGDGFLAGTRNAGALYVHGGTVERLDTTSGLPDDEIEAIAVQAGHAYLGTPLGVAEVDLNDRAHPARVVAAGLFAQALAVTGTELTVGTLDQGVRRVALAPGGRLRRAAAVARGIAPPGDSGDEAAGERSGPESTGRIDQLLSAAGTLYALRDGALIQRTRAGWGAVPHAEAAARMTDGNVSALAFAPDGRLWIGFFDRGLDILDVDTLDQASPPPVHLEDDHLFCLNRLAVDPVRQTMVAATANGLVLFDAAGRPRQTLTRRDGLISDHVNDVAFSGTGRQAEMTVATPAGLSFVSAAGVSSLYAFQGLINNHVYTLGIDGGDGAHAPQMLAGTLGGLSLLTGTPEHVTRNLSIANSGLRHNWITALAVNPQGGWLVGTYGAGLQEIDAAGRFSTPELPAGTPHDLVINPNALLVTSGAVYAGTLGHGMMVWTAATGHWRIIAKGLPSLNVTALAQHEGVLYVGTQNGLVRVKEAAL